MKNIFQKLKNPKVLRPLMIALVVILVVLLVVGYELYKDRVSIDDSLVNAPVTTFSSATNGTLSEMDVYEGEHIKRGDKVAVVGGQAVYADIDGVVVMADTALGTTVTTQTPLVQVINPSTIRIAGTIDENKGLSSLHVGQVVSFTVDALSGQTFWGYVDEISPSAKSTQNAFTISSERPTQQFVVYATFNAEKHPEIKNGMSAKMTIYTKTK